jgi:serine/threonine protein kinase
VSVVEIKHWDRSFLKRNSYEAEDAADRIAQKTRRIAGQAKTIVPNLFVKPKILLTKEPKSLRRDALTIRGVEFHSLIDLEPLMAMEQIGSVVDDDITRICRALAPRSAATLTTVPRRIAHIADLALLSPVEEKFHRIFRGRNIMTQDKVILHLFDLSASTAPNADQRARREFDVVQKLQKSPWLPSLVDSYQALPGFAGELFYYSLLLSEAPTLEERAGDAAWDPQARVLFAAETLHALMELHNPEEQDPVVIHCMLSPAIIRVGNGKRPLFAGWHWARIPTAQTISGAPYPHIAPAFAAPEVLMGGLAAATPASDIFSASASLLASLPSTDSLSEAAREILKKGTATEPEARACPRELVQDLRKLIGDPLPTPPEQMPSSEYWDEDTIVSMHEERFRILGQLGRGGAGRTFKLEQIDRSGHPLGTYVGKVVFNAGVGDAALSAYKRLRAIAHHDNLAAIYQTASRWSPNSLMALLRWIQGAPLGDFAGMIELLAEERGEGNGPLAAEALLVKWTYLLCDALSVLHRHGLAHGDVSPANIIVGDETVTLIDYDLVTKEGAISAGAGTPPFSAPDIAGSRAPSPRDDLYALAATLYYVVTDKQPFSIAASSHSRETLVWPSELREAYPRLAAFADKATARERNERFLNAMEALAFLRGLEPRSLLAGSKIGDLPLLLQPNEVPRLKEILSTYPGSRYGNAETRGLDTAFAIDTYVDTKLDAWLPAAIRNRELSLVILCGNAGDGKTAFLQHLARGLGIPSLSSEQRVWDGRTPDGLLAKINLDGAASWNGRSADELLNQLFLPFHDGPPATPLIHIIAVNDGRLMEWIEAHEAVNGETRLTHQLTEALRNMSELDRHIRLVELNRRSLVGGLAAGCISTEFIDRLIFRLVGAEKAAEIWKPCGTCSAKERCLAARSAQLFGFPETDTEARRATLFRSRLVGALQAVHQRNEVHITTRELKAALSYILFGVHYCKDLHEDPELMPPQSWNLAFDPSSPQRQGEVLRELTRLDPGLSSHARLDRYLSGRGAPDPGHGAPRYPENKVDIARRRAYFEWSVHQVQAVCGNETDFGLSRGRHFAAFRDFPLLGKDAQADLRDAVCRGVSRLEELPVYVRRRPGVLPIRIVPRTPTETAFWIEKPLGKFSLVPEQFTSAQAFETLHRFLELRYDLGEGRYESLGVSLEMFVLLMELSDGAQIADAFSDDVFANLGVFTQRLVQEDKKRLYAWNPAAEDQLFEAGIMPNPNEQKVVLRRVSAE